MWVLICILFFISFNYSKSYRAISFLIKIKYFVKNHTSTRQISFSLAYSKLVGERINKVLGGVVINNLFDLVILLESQVIIYFVHITFNFLTLIKPLFYTLF